MAVWGYQKWHFGCPNQNSEITFIDLIHPQNPQKDTSRSRIRPRKVIFGHFRFTLIFWPRFQSVNNSVNHVCLISHKTYGPIWIPKTVLKSVLWRHSEYAFSFFHFQLLCFTLRPIAEGAWGKADGRSDGGWQVGIHPYHGSRALPGEMTAVFRRLPIAHTHRA